ncbi:MAG: hypothetical protein JWR24_3753 [Actinoallomurus sp.]|jgi:uncharacterized protein (TIGR03086 family)|nr:hypothetical protein [Actinoallomurus sp.]
MQDIRALHSTTGAMAAGVISQISPDQLRDATPCADWDVRAVINHLVNSNLRFAGIVTGEPAPASGEDVLGQDYLADFGDSFDRLCEAFDREGVLEQTFPTPFGEGPGALLVTMRVSELTIHSWDLAAATGQPRDLDAELVAFADKSMRSRPIPRGGQSPFAEEVSVPDGATAADRLAAYAGRRVPAPPA